MDYTNAYGGEHYCLLFKEEIGKDKSLIKDDGVLAGPKYCDMLLQSDNTHHSGT